MLTIYRLINFKYAIIALVLVNGNWAAWESWAECSATCNNGGIRKRNRTCTDPAPMHGGDNCNSTINGELETEACNTDIVCAGKIIEFSIFHQ